MDELEVKLQRAAEAGEEIQGYDAQALLDAMQQTSLSIDVALAAINRATKASLARVWNAIALLTQQDALNARLAQQGMLQYYDLQYLMEIADSNVVTANVVE